MLRRASAPHPRVPGALRELESLAARRVGLRTYPSPAKSSPLHRAVPSLASEEGHALSQERGGSSRWAPEAAAFLRPWTRRSTHGHGAAEVGCSAPRTAVCCDRG